MNKQIAYKGTALVGALLLAGSLVACGSEPDPNDGDRPSTHEQQAVSSPNENTGKQITSQDGTPTEQTAQSPLDSLTLTQRNSLNMLNYLAVLMQEVNASSNSRLQMEEVYSRLINNTNPGAVDERTLAEINYLLDTIESYRMTAVKRERLEYIYERAQAQAIRNAIPNPLGLLSAVQAWNPAQLAASIAYMAVDSTASYLSAASETELQYLQNGWELDDEQAETLHGARKALFSYMVNVVGDYGIPGDATLSEKDVEEFVQWESEDNLASRIRYLESNRSTYESLGDYWLILATSYYEMGSYNACIEAVKHYEQLETKILRLDHDYAAVLPLAISAARESLDVEGYVDLASQWTEEILDNSDHDSWALRYFAAQTYVDLYGLTGNSSFLEFAYQTTLDNINYLIADQRAANNAYLSPIAKASVPEGSTKEAKEEIESYNKLLEAERAKELPPVLESLLLNCDLLVALSAEMDLDEAQLAEIEGILWPQGEDLFLVEPLDAGLRLGESPDRTWTVDDIAFSGHELRIPVRYVSDAASISVTVNDESSTSFEDWELVRVERGTEGDVSTIYAIYTNSEASSYSYAEGQKVMVSIDAHAGQGLNPLKVEFQTVNTKTHWFDAVRIWDNGVGFVQA